MQRDRQEAFLDAMTPVIQELDKRWFPPWEKAPDGRYWACHHCDQNFSDHDKHDDDCLYQLAKNTVQRWDDLDKSSRWLTSPVDNEPRTPEDTVRGKRFDRYRAIWSHFLKDNVSRFIPWDPEHPDNSHSCCSCWDGSDDRHHKPGCPIDGVSKALSALFKI